jgi:putative flippase GtrA
VLTSAGLPPWLANTISAATSVVVLYVIVTRFAFRHRGSVLTFALFAVWYTLSILFFSWLIQVGVDQLGLHPMVSKICTLPLSFVTNFTFSRLLFGTSRSSREPPDGQRIGSVAPVPEPDR